MEDGDPPTPAPAERAGPVTPAEEAAREAQGATPDERRRLAEAASREEDA